MGYFRNILILSIISSAFTGKCQVNESTRLIDSIRHAAVAFLVNNREVTADTRHGYLSGLMIVEIVKSDLLGANPTGIFKFRTFNSPSHTYLLLKDAEYFEIMDPKNLGITLGKALQFMIKEDFSENEIAQYTEEILNVYKGNRYSRKARM